LKTSRQGMGLRSEHRLVMPYAGLLLGFLLCLFLTVADGGDTGTILSKSPRRRVIAKSDQPRILGVNAGVSVPRLVVKAFRWLGRMALGDVRQLETSSYAKPATGSVSDVRWDFKHGIIRTTPWS